jgi:ribosome-associated translation inhibitor RaiA
MIQVIFRNFADSEFTKTKTIERFEAVRRKYPDLKHSHLAVTLEMQNSRVQAGRDVFTVKVLVKDGHYSGVQLKKSSNNLYKALAEVIDHLPGKLNRFNERGRTRERTRGRRILIA